MVTVTNLFAKPKTYTYECEWCGHQVEKSYNKDTVKLRCEECEEGRFFFKHDE